MKACTLLLCSLILLMFSCGTSEDNSPLEPNIRFLQAYERELVDASTRFAMDLFHQLRKSGHPNQFFSPYSIHQALSMTMNGNEGEVLEEFIKLLRFEEQTLGQANKGAKELTEFLLKVDPKVKMAIANAIWFKQEYSLQVPFKETAQQYFNAEVAGLDMLDPRSVKTINDWIAGQTNNLIRDMLDQIPANAVMYLVNAIYFKADWKFAFNPSNTKKQPFFLSNGQSVQVDMMDSRDPITISAYFDNGFSYMEVPYSTGQYSLGILMETEGDLERAMEEFSLENLQAWRSSAQERNVIFQMPKFKLKFKMDNMKEDLMEMGLVRPFNFHPDNFTKLFSNPTDELKISRVIHDAFIEVDEKGSEAAAATVVEIIERLSLPSGPLTIRIDRPFAFFIQEKHSGAILFMGKLTDPGLLDG